MENSVQSPKPHIFSEGSYTENDLAVFKKDHPVFAERDIVTLQLTELFEILHPEIQDPVRKKELIPIFCAERLQGKPERLVGDWVYFPWSGLLVHTLTMAEVYLLRTNRNRNLITMAEQERLHAATIGIAGLSVGGSIASSLVQCGIGSNFKFSEFDTLDTTNLNRVRARLSDVGLPKREIAERALWEVDPSLVIEQLGALTPTSIDTFVRQGFRPAVIFEIIDSFVEKVLLRQAARTEKIPVVMMANLGDSILVDIERYDLVPDLPFFNGAAGNIPEEILANPDIDSARKHQYAVSLVGKEHVPERALASVAEIGKTLVGRPQLGSTVAVAGGIGSYIARQIILGLPLPSGRFLVRFEDFFV